MNDWLTNWTGNLSNVQAQASQALSSFFQPASNAPKSPVQAAEELAKSVQAAAKGTPAAPLVEPIATQAATAAKQVEDASKKSYAESALSTPAAKIAAGAVGFGVAYAVVRRVFK
jgi:hypothetical protein